MKLNLFDEASASKIRKRETAVEFTQCKMAIGAALATSYQRATTKYDRNMMQTEIEL